MSAKKYLSLEEAAEVIGVRPDEVIRLRERGELRGFADRGTWKFKSEDVEEAKRRRQPDSNPEVPLFNTFDESALDEPPRTRGSSSDSDVRLVLDEHIDLKAKLTGSSGDVPVLKTGKGSDSDVRLINAPSPKPKSDSDVKLIMPVDKAEGPLSATDSDSDVRLAPPPSSIRKNLTDSDSDVRLTGMFGSDSDVKLIDPNLASRGTARTELPDLGAIDLDSGSSVLDDESGIILPGDSGIRLTGGSSLKLSGGSSLRLPSGDSNLRLSQESGIQLRRPQDSGILLESPTTGDSGFRLTDESSFKFADDSGIKVGDDTPRSTSRMRQQAAQAGDDLDLTAPMLLPEEDSDEIVGARTDPEVPMLMDDDDLMPKSGDQTIAETNVILFDEDEDLDEAAATIVRKKSSGLSSKELEASEFEMDAEEVLTDDLEVDAEFDEEGLDVFEPEEEGFDESFDEGTSVSNITAGRGGIAAPIEHEWGVGAVLTATFSTMVMATGVIVAADLLRTVWSSGGPVYPGEVIGLFGSFFK